jgi:nucleoside 2-deoxyribosyltransferase
VSDGLPVIYLAIKYHADNKNKNLIENITTACQSAGFETICIARDFEKYGRYQYSPRELMLLSFEKIINCKYLLVDLTEKGVGIGIEAGYAYACGIPIITVLPKDSDRSETLSGISSFEFRYRNPGEIAEFLMKMDHRFNL